MGKKNCWEFKKCGREPGGANTGEFGSCNAATENRADGTNDGRNGGRVCWAIAGTLCKGEVQGTFASKLSNCLSCEFYKLVTEEDGAQSSVTQKVLEKIKG